MTNPAIHALIGHAENLAHLLRAELVASNVGAADAALTFHTLAEAEVAHLIKVLSAVTGVRPPEPPIEQWVADGWEAAEEKQEEAAWVPPEPPVKVAATKSGGKGEGKYVVRPTNVATPSAAVDVVRFGGQHALWQAKARWNPTLEETFRTKREALSQAAVWITEYVKETP